MESLHQPDSVIPAEVLKMDTRSLQMYKKALCDGYEKVYNIRVMVVGQYGVGKTTLTQRLLGKNVNISERHSTEGIDVHVECSKVSLPAGEWTTQEKNAEKYSRLQRLVRLLNEHSNKQESKREQERQSEMADQVTSVEYDNGHTQLDQLIIAEPSTYQKVKQPSSHPVESPIVRLGPDASSGIHSKENEKDTVMKILKQVNENSGKLEKDAVQYAALALWDFAGQYAFYTTHQTFLTSRAIYLLVIDLSQQVTDLIKDDECFLDAKGRKPCNIPEMIEIWLNMIHFCSPSSHPGNPPVILVGTHVDKIPEKNRQKVIDEYFMKIRQMLKNKPLVFHLMDDIAIDNTQCDPSLEKLKRRIFELASQQPHWGEEKPARWLPLEQAIMTMKDSNVKVAPLSLIEEINRSSSIKIEDRSELEMFLSFQHAIGTILYFNADGLREKIVLDPQWMIDVFRSLITAKMFIKQNPTITKEWFEFEEKGKLTHKLIDAIWTKKEKPDFHDNKKHLILVMEKLNIIARPRSYTMDGKSVKKEDYYLAPCILRQEMPREMICPVSGPNEKSTSALCFVCKEKCLPPPIFHRLVGACLTHFPIAKQDEENLIYCGCCAFDIDNYHRLSLHFLGHVIFARVTIMGVTDISKSSKLCSEARTFIFENLSKIIGNLGQSLEFELHIQCPSCDADSLKGMIAVPKLQQEKVVVCRSHVESHTLESQQLLKFWFEDGEQIAIEGRGREKGFKVDETSEVPEKVPSTSRNTGVPCSDPKLLCQLLQKSQQASSANQSTLEANCLSVGLELHGETPADGNCFFEAVSSQLQRLNCVVQKSPQQLRQEVAAFMRANRVIQASEGTIHLDSFIYNESFDDYCSRMARDSEWADHVVVVAMARMLQIDIMIVTSLPSSGPENIIVWVVGKTAFQEDPILLGHVWESHYMSLQPIATIVLDQGLAGPSSQDQTDVPTPAPTAHIMQIAASGSTSSTAVGFIRAPTTNASPSISNGSTSSTTPYCKISDVLQCSISSFATIDVIQAPISESTTVDIMQLPLATSTRADVMPFLTSPSSLSTNINGLVQSLTTGSTPSLTSTTHGVMQTATSSFIRTDLMQTSSFGSSTAVMQAPTSVPTATNVLLATTSVSTPSTTTGSKPCPTPTSTTAVVMQAPSSGSTTDIVQASASGSKLSTITGSTLCPNSASTTVNAMQVPTSASTTDIIQSPASDSTTNAMHAPASGSTAADILQSSTASGSTSHTTVGLMPVLSSCYTAGGLWQPQASSSIPSTTADVMQASSVDGRDRFMHIACLLLNVGSRVLRRLLHFHTVTPTCTLDQYLAKKRIDIDNLRKRKILNKSQMDILFPPGGSTNLGDYDITLLSALFTNIVPNISPQQLNMIQSLRDKRNEIVAHAISATVNSNDYQTFWNDICSVLEALCKQCGDPDFENEIPREIQGIQVSTVQGRSLIDTLQTHHRRMETLERLVQDLISSHTQESNQESDDSDS